MYEAFGAPCGTQPANTRYLFSCFALSIKFLKLKICDQSKQYFLS